MRKVKSGVFAGGILSLCIALIILINYVPDRDEPVKQSNGNDVLKQQLQQVTQSLEAKEAKMNKLLAELDQTKSELYPYRRFVSEVLQADHYPMEIIYDQSDQMIVYAPTYLSEVPANTDLQKLFLLRLINQLPQGKNKKVTFWSSREDAMLYASGKVQEEASGERLIENSKFGTLIRDGNATYLWHHLSVHEMDAVTFGTYAKEQPARQ